MAGRRQRVSQGVAGPIGGCRGGRAVEMTGVFFLLIYHQLTLTVMTVKLALTV